MTIYSQHPNRGKVQILATYHGPVGVMSSTVTSVDDASLAEPIVDALNRISACATMPVSVHDTRGGRSAYYPTDHIAALIDRSARADLLCGAYSLWYENTKLLLHQALTDLDAVTAGVPDPVLTAITAELETEVRGLREASMEFSEGISSPDTDNRRIWEFGNPLVAFEGTDGLDSEDRDSMNRLERGFTDEQLKKGVSNLRLLRNAYMKCINEEAMLAIGDFVITDDPYPSGPDRYFLDVIAPSPSGDGGPADWVVDICQWDIDLDDPKNEGKTATGEHVLRCSRAESPTLDEIVELLNRSGGRPEQLAAWAKTAVGDALIGTTFTVTERYDD